MKLTREQAEARLSDPRNTALALAQRLTIRKVKDGHSITHQGTKTAEDTTKLTPMMRNLVAILGQTEPHGDVAKEFNLSRQYVTRLSNGVTNQSSKTKNPELVKVIEEYKDTIIETALERTMKSFNLMTDDKLEGSSARELSTIAKNSVDVVEKLQQRQANGPALSIVIQVPPRREQTSYPVVDLN